MPNKTRNRRNPLETRLNFRISQKDRETINAAAGDWSSPSELGRAVMHWYCEALRSGKTLTHPLQFVESKAQTPPNEHNPKDKK